MSCMFDALPDLVPIVPVADVSSVAVNSVAKSEIAAPDPQ